MPLLQDGAERCALRTGSYTVGGNGPDALPIARLECCPAVAILVVPPDGPATIQRLTARVVVFLDRTPLGIAAKELHNGAQIEFGDCCLTFAAGPDGEAAITSASSGVELGAWAAPTQPLVSAPARVSSAERARIVNVRTGETIELGNHRVVVGRDESCDFVVRGMGVSRRHFSVAPVQGGYLLRDESANGTLVNGSRVVGTYLLGAGDMLRLDEDDLRFEVDGAAPAVGADAAPTALLDLSYVRSAVAMDGRRDQPPPRATLEIGRGRYAGASFAVDRAVCAIGRGPENDVRIRDESVSANHATLLRKGATWFVVDLRSANGTFVDGSRVAGEREIATGARLKLGAVELTFRSVENTEKVTVETTRKESWMQRLLRPFTAYRDRQATTM